VTLHYCQNCDTTECTCMTNPLSLEPKDDGGPAFPTDIGPGTDGGFQCGNERWHAPGLPLINPEPTLWMPSPAHPAPPTSTHPQETQP